MSCLHSFPIICKWVPNIYWHVFDNFRFHRRHILMFSENHGIDYPPVVSQANNLRGMLLGMVDDPRVVLIKLADRLHNMRTMYVILGFSILCSLLCWFYSLQPQSLINYPTLVYAIFIDCVFPSIWQQPFESSRCIDIIRQSTSIWTNMFYYWNAPLTSWWFQIVAILCIFCILLKAVFQLCSSHSQSWSCCSRDIGCLVLTCFSIGCLGFESWARRFMLCCPSGFYSGIYCLWKCYSLLNTTLLMYSSLSTARWTL